LEKTNFFADVYVHLAVGGLSIKYRYQDPDRGKKCTEPGA
jgi:hypothetical protein